MSNSLVIYRIGVRMAIPQTTATWPPCHPKKFFTTTKQLWKCTRGRIKSRHMYNVHKVLYSWNYNDMAGWLERHVCNDMASQPRRPVTWKGAKCRGRPCQQCMTRVTHMTMSVLYDYTLFIATSCPERLGVCYKSSIITQIDISHSCPLQPFWQS